MQKTKYLIYYWTSNNLRGGVAPLFFTITKTKEMTELTKKHIKLNKHIYTKGGAKTVCVSTCLSFFGIEPNQYHYTSSNTNIVAYKNVLRRFGYSVRSRNSMFKLRKRQTMTNLKQMLRKSEYGAKDYFVVSGYQSKVAHLMVLNGNGETLIDTAPNSRWHIRDIAIVE